MTPTEIARRSDAFYTDTNNMHRRQLCDMIAHREADIEKLKEEAYGLHCDIGRLEVENAELRELVRGMWSYINAPVNRRNNLKERLAIYDDLADRMRELGVEVDE